MPKTKCIICKAENIQADIKKNPNLQNIGLYKIILNSIKSRNKEAINTICEDHRNVLKFNICVIDLFNQLPIIEESFRTNIPISYIK